MERTPKTYQLRFLSIVRLNEQFWRSAISVYFVIWSIIFRMTGISEFCESNISIRTVTGRVRHFAYGKTVREAPLVATGKISESAVLFLARL